MNDIVNEIINNLDETFSTQHEEHKLKVGYEKEHSYIYKNTIKVVSSPQKQPL